MDTLILRNKANKKIIIETQSRMPFGSLFIEDIPWLCGDLYKNEISDYRL